MVARTTSDEQAVSRMGYNWGVREARQLLNCIDYYCSLSFQMRGINPSEQF
jgi:hypothetical protein